MNNLDNDKVILCVAPSWKVTGEPWDLESLQKDLERCISAGASMIHMHIGSVVAKGKNYTQSMQSLIDQLKPSQAVFEGSTGMVGIEHPVEKRCEILGVDGWDLVSLNMGSTNFGENIFYNPLSLIRSIAEKIKIYGAKPDLEVFEIGMIESSLLLAKEGIISSPYIFNVTLGMDGTTMAPGIRNLLFFKESFPNESIWGYVHNNMSDMSELMASINIGASFIRVGFENAKVIDDQTVPKSNYDFVARAVELLKKMNKKIATPQEARVIMGLNS